MRKVISLSALVSGLLASPMLAAVPREQETAIRGALVSPADANPVAQLHALLEAGPADVGGMRNLQRRMVANVHDQLAELLAQGPAAPANGNLKGRVGDFPNPAPPAMPPSAAPDVFQGILGSAALQQLTIKAAFLGVTTSTVSETLGQQLGLAAGMGLVVDFVAKDSPAQAAGLQVHDVLQKLDDQLLINPPQLAILVRSKKAGDTIALAIIREAHPLTLKATLVEKEMPALEIANTPALLEIPVAAPAFPSLNQPAAAEPWHKQTQTHFTLNADGSTTTTLTDTAGEITLQKAKNGTASITAADPSGKQIYAGPFTTEEDRKKAPPDIAQRIARIHPTSGAAPLTLGPAGPYVGGMEIHSGTLIYRADDAHTILLSIGDDAHKTMSVTVKDARTGKTIYEGPANTEDDFKKMPPEVAAKVKAIEQKVTAK